MVPCQKQTRESRETEGGLIHKARGGGGRGPCGADGVIHRHVSDPIRSWNLARSVGVNDSLLNAAMPWMLLVGF
jgi:hypothetical protein